jgi:hypothetical protein
VRDLGQAERAVLVLAPFFLFLQLLQTLAQRPAAASRKSPPPPAQRRATRCSSTSLPSPQQFVKELNHQGANDTKRFCSCQKSLAGWSNQCGRLREPLGALRGLVVP